jgi:hypothetical protein
MVAGLCAIDARDLMRRFDDVQPESMIGSWIAACSRTGAEVARAVADDGYLKVYNVDRDGVIWRESTIKGSALAQASFRPPVTRATAERLLGGVIDRAKAFNADESHLVDITELVSSRRRMPHDRRGLCGATRTFQARPHATDCPWS